MYNHQEPEAGVGTVISNNPIVNLTATLASVSFLFGLFLCFADQRSRTVRRYSVQSVGLGAIWLTLALVLWIVGLLLGAIPFVGIVFSIICIIIGVFVTLIALYMRVRMMFSAYRGLAYTLPLFGEVLRRFE